ncbi:MAG: dipeptidase PepE [Pyrinomonadaceae bacterium]|nr:dipeptidase PepE [Pyrinomonadaceae bacterium]
MKTPGETKRLLLISNSTLYGSGYLDHAEEEIRHFLGKIGRVLFVPFALFDRDGYTAKTRTRFNAMGYKLDSIHEAPDKPQAVRDAAAIFIGGGNTFRLLKALYDFQILMLIREKVEGGIPYVGSSAGSNVAGPTIKTTNDLPIVEPPSFEALNLVSFQINPHYLDPDPDSKHMGETREERILQFFEENDKPVVGLREGAMIRVEGNANILKGSTGGRIFRQGQQPIEVKPGTTLDELIT